MQAIRAQRRLYCINLFLVCMHQLICTFLRTFMIRRLNYTHQIMLCTWMVLVYMKIEWRIYTFCLQ